MDRRERIAAWALAASVTACGGRTALTSSGGGQPAACPITEAAAPCASWTVAPGEPIALTDHVAKSLLIGSSVEGGRVFVASLDVAKGDAPTFISAWRVRVVSGDLQTIGPSQVVLTTPPPDGPGGTSLSTGFGHRGMIGEDAFEESGCRFLALADDGAAAAPPVTLDDVGCFALSATETGFIYFSAPTSGTGPISRTSLDPAGNLVEKTPSVIAVESAVGMSGARFDDGTMLIAWWSSSSGAVLAQRVGETGGALSSPKTLFQSPMTGPFVAPWVVTSVGSSGLAVWVPGESSPGEIDVLPIDKDGNPTGPTTAVTPADGKLVAGLDAAPVAGGALIAWTKGEPTSLDSMIVQAVCTTGALIGPPLSVPSPKKQVNVKLAPTPTGVVLAFDAMPGPAPRQVFAVRLVCGA